MNIVCVICSDLLIPSDDVFNTPCGHIFHFACLTQWLERSKSCPQCREKTTQNRIHRIYFNFSNNDTITEDTTSLQDKVDKLNFKMLILNQEVQQLSEKNTQLEKQNAGLRKEVRSVEAQINERNSAIHALKDQIKYFKQQSLEVENAKQEVTRLQKKVEEYRNIQILLDAPSEDVDEMISRTRDPHALITYVSVMKREMVTCMTRRRELRAKVKSLQQELTKVSMERNFLSDEHHTRKKLEDDLLKCESEKLTLQNEIGHLRAQILSCQCKPSTSSTSEQNSVDLESSIQYVSPKTPHQGKSRSEIFKKVEENISPNTAPKEKDKESPYLPVKSQAVFTLHEQVQKRRLKSTKSSSTLIKKLRIDGTDLKRSVSSLNSTTFNGLGGTSKLEAFPVRINSDKLKKSKDEPGPSKRMKFDAGRNQKLSDFVRTSSTDTSTVVID